MHSDLNCVSCEFVAWCFVNVASTLSFRDVVWTSAMDKNTVVIWNCEPKDVSSYTCKFQSNLKKGCVAYTLHCDTRFPLLKIASYRGGPEPPFNSSFLQPTMTHHPKRHLDRTCRFPKCIFIINGQTDRQNERGTRPIPILGHFRQDYLICRPSCTTVHATDFAAQPKNSQCQQLKCK